MVTVTDDHRFTTGLVQDVRILGSKSGQFADGRIFFKDDLAVVAGENFQRVTLADAQGAADFLGNDHTTQSSILLTIPVAFITVRSPYQFGLC